MTWCISSTEPQIFMYVCVLEKTIFEHWSVGDRIIQYIYRNIQDSFKKGARWKISNLRSTRVYIPLGVLIDSLFLILDVQGAMTANVCFHNDSDSLTCPISQEQNKPHRSKTRCYCSFVNYMYHLANYNTSKQSAGNRYV